MKRKFIYFVVILALILGAAGLWYSSKNIYSKEVLKLEIIGPTEADLAEEIEYLVKYKNNGDVRLEDPTLTFEFPKYSIVEEGKSLRHTIGPEELGGAIYPGEEKTLKFKCRLLGKEEEPKEVKASLGWRAKNLSAWYESSTTFTTIIKKVPLTFTFDLPSRVESEKEIEFRLNYYSNTDFPLSNLRIKADYPSGFEFKESDPKALEKNEWEIGILNKAEGGRIEIMGNLEGDVGEQKNFSAKIGSWQDGEFILLKEVFKGVEIVNPDLYILQQINGSPEYIASPGDILHYEIFFRNLGQESLSNIFLLSKLEGEAFDLESIKAPDGSFESGDNTILFDWRKNPQLQILEAQEEGRVEFWVELKEEWDISESNETNIINQVILSQVRDELETKVNSRLLVLQNGFYQDEAFGNSGPTPPKAGEETTYTINWQVKNYYNDVNNIKVKAILPNEVELTGKIFPEEQSEKFTFDSRSREIVWDVGDLEAGTGVLNNPPNVSFQISLRPSSSQIGDAALLISKARITGEDQWTGQKIESESEEIDSSLGNEDAGEVR